MNLLRRTAADRAINIEVKAGSSLAIYIPVVA